MTTPSPSGWAKYVPHGLVAYGAVSFLADVALETWFFGPAALLTPTSVVFNVMALAFTGGIAWGGYWLDRSGVEVARCPRAAKWTIGFSIAFLAINLFLISQFPDGTLFGNLAWALWATYVGGLGGVIVGTFEARAIHRAVQAERDAVHAEHLENQRQWLDYLNSLLRHEVLNNASIIQGYASLLLDEEDLPSPARKYVETIHRQSRDMTDVIGDVRVLVRAVERSVELRAIDVVDVLFDELGDLEATHPEVETDLSAADEGTYVLADSLLPRIFSNLLSNAVEHDPGDSPRVGVEVEVLEESVQIEIADDGPGIPDAEREALFERGQEDHGLGLYLVRVLADRYGGTVDLVETGPEGSVFAVELPRTDPPTDDGPEPGESNEASAVSPAPR